MLTNNLRMVETLGEFNPARGILLAIYTTILAASIFLLIYPDTKFSIALLLMQIVYKLLTPFTVKTVKHPFVISNILIAVVHLVTVYSLW
jgi:hypothetical protein